MKYRLLLLLLVVAALLLEGYALYSVLTRRSTDMMREEVVARNDFSVDR